VIEEGSWRARAVSGALGKASTGNPQVGVELEILEGPSTGAHITWYGYFSEATFARTVQSLRLMGWRGAMLSDLNGLGRHEVRVVVEHEANQDGQLIAKAQWINELSCGVAMRNPMSNAEARQFAAEMRPRVIDAESRNNTTSNWRSDDD
jgi:hypothetical protein